MCSCTARSTKTLVLIGPTMTSWHKSPHLTKLLENALTHHTYLKSLTPSSILFLSILELTRQISKEWCPFLSLPPFREDPSTSLRSKFDGSFFTLAFNLSVQNIFGNLAEIFVRYRGCPDGLSLDRNSGSS